MTYDYSWVLKIRILEGNWIRKGSYHRKWNIDGVKETLTFLSNIEVLNQMLLLRKLLLVKRSQMKMEHFEKLRNILRYLGIKFSEEKV